MVFNDAVQLIVSFRRFEAVSRLTDLPESIQKFANNTGLLLGEGNYKFVENGISGYHIFMLGIFGVRGYRYSLDFDSNGNFITSQLNISIVQNRK